VLRVLEPSRPVEIGWAASLQVGHPCWLGPRRRHCCHCCATLMGQSVARAARPGPPPLAAWCPRNRPRSACSTVHGAAGGAAGALCAHRPLPAPASTYCTSTASILVVFDVWGDPRGIEPATTSSFRATTTPTETIEWGPLGSGGVAPEE
jgi:hypothetical protein